VRFFVPFCEFILQSSFYQAFFAPKERRKLASHIVAGLAPAKPPVLKGRRKTPAIFHRAIRHKFISSAATSHFVAG